jgi:glycosyltransferase involved in cell wall biosynthesis
MRPRLKIGILNDSARIGGAERGLIQLAQNLDSKQFEVIVVCPGDGPLIDKLRKAAISVISMDLSYFSIKRPSSYLKYLRSLVSLYYLIKELRLDILHCNSCRAAHWGIPLSRVLSIQTICHVRDNQYTKATRFLLRHAPENVTVVAVSKATKRAVHAVGVPESKITVIYNGEDSGPYFRETITDLLNEEFPESKKRLKVGIIGRIVPWKRHIDLIEAAGLLREKVDLHVFIVGELWDGENTALSKLLHDRIDSLRLGERVTFLGFRDDTREILAGLDIIVVPSEEEPFGRVVIEAMAMGKPVIGAVSGAIPEIIRDGIDGLLVPVKNPDCIAKAIQELAYDKDHRDNLGNNGRRRMVSVFSVESYVRAIETLYGQLAVV